MGIEMRVGSPKKDEENKKIGKQSFTYQCRLALFFTHLFLVRLASGAGTPHMSIPFNYVLHGTEQTLWVEKGKFGESKFSCGDKAVPASEWLAGYTKVGT